MPAVTTMVYPAPAYVRVEVNWADVGAAVGAAVYRVDCLTGERVPLRPYVSFDGDFIDLSCGYAIFWDTEPQLDRCIYYCTQAIDAAGQVVTAPSAYLYQDTFTRTVVNGWGTSDSGHTYTLNGGTVPGDYDVTAGKGTFTMTTEDVARTATVVGLSVPNGRFYGWYQHPVLPTGANHEIGIRVRYVDDNNFADLRLFFETSGNVTAALRQIVAGVETAFVGFTQVPGVTATSPLAYVIEYWGGVLRAKVWLATDPEPPTYVVITTLTWVTAGTIQYRAIIAGASTTVLPITLQWDSFLLVDPCAELIAVETCSDDLVVPSSGDFRLGDPVRPCNDVTLLFDAPVDPDCVPTQGIFFGSMGPDEVYAANSGTFQTVNDKYPIVVNRQRAAVGSTLTVATRTFADRDAMIALNDPGAPLMIRGPVQYGIPDQYMAVTDVTITRHVSDHKVQPRSIGMPYVRVRRVSGPAQGVCGTRVTDLCDIYASWSAVEAAGLSFADLLRGKASLDTPKPASVERTWSDVNATYASWNAEAAANVDWNDLRDGA